MRGYNLLKNLSVIAGVVVVGYILLVLVYCIPDKILDKNVRSSAEKLNKEGIYPDVYATGSFLDNFTDAACISIVINRKNDNPFYSAINAFQSGSGKDGVSKLYQTVFDKSSITEGLYEDHSYLWHGFRIYLRPLLCLYNIQDIRVLCEWIIYALSLILCIMIFRQQQNFFSIIPFLCGFLFFNFQLEALSLLFFNDICVMLTGCIVIACSCIKGENYTDEIFAAFGAVIAFTSMLIMPILSVGFMLVFYLIFSKNNYNWKQKIFAVIKHSISWLMGYALVTFLKVFVSIKFINYSIRGQEQVTRYWGGSFIDRIYMSYAVLYRVFAMSNLKLHVMLIGTLIFLTAAIRKKGYMYWKIFMPYLLIAFFPVIWVLVMCGHSGHGWTYYNYSISIFAILEGIYLSIINHENNP